MISLKRKDYDKMLMISYSIACKIRNCPLDESLVMLLSIFDGFLLFLFILLTLIFTLEQV